MHTSRRAILLTGAALCVIAIVLTTIVRSFPSSESVRRAREDERVRVQSAQSLYSERTGFQPIASVDDLNAALSVHLRQAAAEALGDERADTLLSDAASFLQKRVGGQSPSEYASWRLSQGYTWRPYSELADRGIVDAFRIRTSQVWTPSDPVGDRFAEMWRSAREWKGKANVPRAIGTSKESMGIVGGLIDRLHPTTARPIGQVIPASGGDETNSLSMVQWLVHPRNRDILLSENATVEYATIGVLIEYMDGSRRPLVLTYLWDPKGRSWVHHSLTMYAGMTSEILGIDF